VHGSLKKPKSIIQFLINSVYPTTNEELFDQNK